MKKQKKLLLVILIMFTFVLGLNSYDAGTYNTSALINIMECSSSFMNKYFEEVGKIEDEDKENILIVTSKTKIIDTYGATKVIEAPNNQYILMYSSTESKDKALNRLTSAKGILTVEENIIYEISAFNSWGVTSTGMDLASTRLEGVTRKDDIVIAIIDTGLNVTLFKNNYPTKLAGAYNALTGSTSTSAMTDENGHGTHIAGTIAESTPSNVKIFPAKASNGSTLSSVDIIACINYITNNNKANVINMSFGSYTAHEATRQAIQAANAEGIICVAAAGNESTAQTAYPAGYDETIAVSAIDSSNNMASFSNIGQNITFAAPGVSIKSINATMSGTSMAAPHVAAAAAIVKSYNKDFTMEEVIEILKSNAVDLGTPGWDYQYGYGVISFINFAYCSCNCATCDSVSCDGCECISCIHRDLTKNVTKIEIGKNVVETYNYGSVTNLGNTELKIYYGSNYLTKKLWELDDVTVMGYDPYKYTSQTITITFAGKSATTTLSARTEPASFWNYSIISGTNIKLTGMKATPIPKLELPEKIGSYTVTTVGNGLFKTKTLTKVTLPATITNVETEAFYQSTIVKLYSNAETLTLGNKVFAGATKLEEITSQLILNGTETFDECYSLKTVTLDDSNTSIPYSTFYLCTNMREIEIPENVTTIGDYAFTNTNIQMLIIPNKVTSVGKYAFANSFRLTTLSLGSKLETIDEGAFMASANIYRLTVPASVTTIGDKAFRNCTGINYIIVSTSNTKYNSGVGANALIETATGELIAGTRNTIIPSSVKTIGEYAFAYNQLLTAIDIPEGVTTIETKAFYGVENLMQVILPTTVTTIGTNAFGYTPINLVFWVHSSSYGKTYASSNSRYWRTYNPSAMTVYGMEDTYTAFETLSTSDLYIMAKYTDYDGTRTEYITSGIDVEYASGNSSFRATDTYVILIATNNLGKAVRGKVTIAVNKATPTYTIPTGLSAVTGQKLSEITLPTGFSWMAPTTVVSGTGNKEYLVKYTPTDTVNYNTVENIRVTVSVTSAKTEITPTVTITDKVYNGDFTIDVSTVSVAELSKGEYTVESATLSSANVGTVTATVKIKLTDVKFKSTTFAGGKQECEVTVSMKIVPMAVEYPTKVEKTYTYTGKEQEFEVNGFDSNIMSITGNKRTNAGSQTVTIKLTNTNYIWTDGTRNNKTFTFKIEKANIIYTAEDGHYIADGNGYGISITLTNPLDVTITYADASGNYTLTTMPTYTAVGTHVIKFKLSAGDNYNEVYDERKVYIHKDGIINTTKDKEVIYDGLEHTLTMNINMGDVTIRYSVDDKDYDLTELPMFKNVGEYTVNYKIEKEGFITVYGSNKVKIYGVKKTASSIKIDGTYLRIKDFNTNYSDIINKITVYAPSHSFAAHDKNGVDKNESTMHTGDYISIYITSTLGLNTLKYKVVVLGDANLDGKISALDYVRIKNHIMKDPEIKEGLSLLSADANDDGKISALDYVRIKNHIMDGGK